MRLAPLAVAALLVLSGCSAVDLPGAPDDAPEDGELGVENGVTADAEIDVDSASGLTKAELAKVKSRMMARLELLRGLEFTDDVSIEVISRAEYRQRAGNRSPSSLATEQYWESIFVVNESARVSDQFGQVYGSSVQGFYAGGRIVIVSDDPSNLTVDRNTLAHELQHALQAQHFSLATDGRTRDRRLAGTGVIEGDANYVEAMYDDRCRTGEWECLPLPERSGGGGGAYNTGLFLSLFAPYAEGPEFVQTLHDRGGWDAVNGAFEDHPDSTAELLHPGTYPEAEPVAVRVADRSNDRWSRTGDRDTIGEATLYSALWANGVIPEADLREDTGNGAYDYEHPTTTGWAGDTIVAYTTGENDSQGAYVFESRWETRGDARAFYEAYLTLLEDKGAREVREGVYRIPEGENGFADAFRVVRSGKTVRVVNAPKVAALDGVHAPPETDGTTEREDTAPVPGFGPVAATVAVAAVALVLARRRVP